MGHKQDPTRITTDNTTADGIANGTVKTKRTTEMDMHFHWVRDRVEQDQFRVIWKPGKDNYGDYFTKHHPPSHHIKMRPTYLQVAKKATTPESKCEGELISDSGLSQSRVTSATSQPESQVESQTISTHSQEKDAGAPTTVAELSHIGKTHLVHQARGITTRNAAV